MLCLYIMCLYVSTLVYGSLAGTAPVYLAEVCMHYTGYRRWPPSSAVC